MNEKKTAREKVQRQRQRERRARLWRRAAVAVAVAVAAAVGVTVAIATADTGSKGGVLVVPAHAQGTEIVYGKADAPHTLDLYEDFRCPVCRNLEQTEGKTIQDLADQGIYKIRFHMGTFLDRNLGGSGSLKALAAAGAALDQGPDKFKAFHDVLYAGQPDESTDSFADTDFLLGLAAKVPGLRTAAFDKQVRDGVFEPWAAKVSAAFNASGVSGTPTAKLDGKQLDLTGKIPFRTQIEQAK